MKPSILGLLDVNSIQHRAQACSPPQATAPGKGNAGAPWVCSHAVTPSSDIPFFSSTNE